MKRVYFIAILSMFYSLTLFSQAAWVEPNPANVNDSIMIFIDVSQPDCECPSLINLDAEGDSLFLWTWEPTENATINNGQWNSSNHLLRMTSEGNNIWSYTMLPTVFYNVDASEVYDIGLSFLIKKFDGSAIDGVEPKSTDLHVDIDPLGCANTLCSFPTVFQEDDYLTMIYNNLLETYSSLQNMTPDECYMLPVAVAGGVDYPYFNGSVSDPAIVTIPELHMQYEGDGKFYTTILSDQFFRVDSDNPVPEGVPIEKIKVRFRKTVFTGNISQYYELTFKCE